MATNFLAATFSPLLSDKGKVKSEKSYSMAFKGKGENPIASLSEE